jgi:haloalkane dehalogenase
MATTSKESSVQFRPSRELFPFESRWFESSVGPVHYVDEGSGAPILFLHGNPTWSFVYRNIIVALRPTFRCIAPDYPGFGLSSRPDRYGYTPQEQSQIVTELVDHLGLDHMIVMGQDWGGPIGCAVASRDPDRVRGMVMANTSMLMSDRLPNRIFSKVMSSRLMQRRILEQNFFVENLIPSATSRRLSEEEIDHYRKVQPSPEARLGVAEFPRQLLLARDWMESLKARVEQTLGGKKALFVWGAKDIAFPPRVYLPRWQSTFPDNVTVVFPEAKHFLQEDAPGEVAQAILDRFASSERRHKAD